MRSSIIKGISFGLTSGVITTLGLIVGLHSTTGSLKVVVGGIFVIAIADALSDALGVHISEESENNHTAKEIWVATIFTFVAKFIFSLIFVIPFLFLPLLTAIQVSVIFGLFIIAVFSFYIAKEQKISSFEVVGEHLLIASLVIAITHFVGDWISKFN